MLTPIKYEYEDRAYFAEDGNYGVDYVLTFNFEEFNQQYPDAWDIVDDIAESQRIEFILAVINQDEESLRELADDYEFDLSSVLA